MYFFKAYVLSLMMYINYLYGEVVMVISAKDEMYDKLPALLDNLSCVAFIDFLLIRNEEKNPSCM
jgi:hypothetical protein